MIKVIIVDDEESAFRKLQENLAAFSRESNVLFDVKWYSSPLLFLEEYKGADVVFLDIEMPEYDGMRTAERLRKRDENVVLLFVTNMAGYAIKGYSVNALDYILKPVLYPRFSSLMKKVVRLLGKNADVEIIVRTTGGVKRLYASSVMYVEIRDHLLVYHTEKESVDVWGSLKEASHILPDFFVRCNHAVIVNLNHILSIDKDTIYLKNSNEQLTISRNKRKEFMVQLNKYVGLK